MKTPYDAALRLRQREIDTMRVSITAEVNRMTALAAHRDVIDTLVRSEVAVANDQSVFSAQPFLARMCAERETLCREHVASDVRLSALRAQAVEVYGSLSALESAAGRHRDDLQRAVAIAEQGQSDDFSAARFTRAAHTARNSRNAQANDA